MKAADDIRIALRLSAIGFDAEARGILREHYSNPVAAAALKSIEDKDASTLARALPPLESCPCF